ncbi:ATP-binding protein [Actinomadura sp. 3N508]|uniref:ATP-binding protein n=1 Tax=Actinomadura sp. 3N508 TaxID=3375153 RepID=UPI003791F8CA
MTDWPYHTDLPLAAMADAPYWARRHIEDILPKWGAGSLVMNAQLVATELVTNGVKHSGGSMELPNVVTTGGRAVPAKSVFPKKGEGVSVRLSLSYGEGRLLIEVWDKSETPPAEQLPDFVSESGRGLFVVSAFCEKWGWYLAEGGGKVVWAEVAA